MNPYGDHALAYHDAGWPVFPLPFAQKKPAPRGRTGRPGVNATREQIEAETRTHAGGNIAARVDSGFIGLDVDAYDGKPGKATLDELIIECGPLPDTYVSTSKSDGVSGIRHYRVPTGIEFISVLPGIEIIQRHHRYAVAWPSVHDKTGETYRWTHTATWETYDGIPARDDLPELPARWVARLTATGNGSTGKATMPNAKVKARLDEWFIDDDGGEPCPHMRAALGKADQSVTAGNSRHDTCRDASLSIVRYAEKGHPGAGAAISELRSWFFDRLDGDRDGSKEWADLITGAVGIVENEPTPDDEKGCSGEPEIDEEAFWNARPILAHIRQYARARLVAPWATLGAVLARAVASVPPSVVLPPVVGSIGSLNLFTTNVAASGGGKNAALSSAHNAVIFKGGRRKVNNPSYEPHQRELGTGQGIIARYAHKVTDKDPITGDKFQKQVWVRHSVLFTLGEIDQLTSHAGQQAANIIPTLTQAWMAEQIGSSYKTVASDIDLPAHTYRMCLIANVQPKRARVLIDAETLGLPQRFIWLPADDPDMPDVTPECPEPMTVYLPVVGDDLGPELTIMTLCETARAEIVADRRAKNAGTWKGNPLDSHLLLGRMKLAAAFALLEDRFEITEEDWDLAGVVAAKSVETRSRVVSELTSESAQKSAAKRADVVKTAVEVTAADDAQKIEKAANRVLTVLSKSGGWMAGADLRRDIGRRHRDHLEDALDGLITAKRVESEPTDRGVRYQSTG